MIASPGFVSYWHNYEDELLYYYPAILAGRTEIIESLVDLAAQFPLDIEAATARADWIERSFWNAVDADKPPREWLVATRYGVLTLMGFEFEPTRKDLQPIWIPRLNLAPDEPCEPELEPPGFPFAGPDREDSKPPAPPAIHPTDGLLQSVVGTALAAPCEGGGGPCQTCCTGSCCDDPCCADACCIDPCLCDPCCVDVCSCDRCCRDGENSQCCRSDDPCCNPFDPCCGDPDPCCNPDNPDCGVCTVACCNSTDPCCNTTDPCCDNDDPCDSTCGDTCVCDPCDPSCVDCDDQNACTTDSCSSGTCSHEPIDCNDGDACTVDSCSGGTCSNTPTDCDDGNACTADSCSGGVCSHESNCAEGLICCGGTCCPNGQVCCGDRCCPSGQTCCGDTCCLAGEACCSEVCCVGGEVCCESQTCCCPVASTAQFPDNVGATAVLSPCTNACSCLGTEAFCFCLNRCRLSECLTGWAECTGNPALTFALAEAACAVGCVPAWTSGGWVAYRTCALACGLVVTLIPALEAGLCLDQLILCNNSTNDAFNNCVADAGG